MAKMRCPCGTSVSTSGNIPNENELLVISDVDFEQWASPIDADRFYMALQSLFRCPTSGHLFFFDQGFEAEPLAYAPLGRLGEGAL